MRTLDRTDEPDAVWHITSRVNWQAWHLEPERAANTFLECLGDSAERFGVDLKADVVMSNHYHIVAQSPDTDAYRRLTGRRTTNRHFRPWPAGHPKSTVIGQFIRAVKLSVAKRIQGAMGLKGHFWEGKHHRRRLEDARAMVVAIAYDHRNPVKEGMVARPEEYERSSAAWWMNGRPSSVPLCQRGEFPFGVPLEVFRAHLIRFQQEKALDGVMARFRESGHSIDTVRGRAYLDRLLKEARVDPLPI